LQFQVLILFFVLCCCAAPLFPSYLGKLNEVVKIHDMNLTIFVAQYFKAECSLITSLLHTHSAEEPE
jgi:hypothetical protein